MKSYLLFVLILALGANISYAQTNTPQPISSTIAHVKVHLQGAEVMRKTTANLKAGRNEIVLTNLSPKLYQKTIQISAKKGVNILSITTKSNFIDRRKASPKIKVLKDSVALLKDEISLLNDERQSFVEEKDMLKQNRSIKSNQQNLTIEALQIASDFYRAQNFEINKKLTELNKKIEDKNTKLFDYKLQLYEMNADRRAMVEIHLVLESDVSAEIPLDFRYVVSDAGWAAVYDLESANFSDKINLNYRGLCYNNTGVDWENVKLTLSTADPLQTMVQPSLKVWSLDNASTSDINYIANTNIDISVNNNAPIQQQQILQSQLYAPQLSRKDEIFGILGEDFDKNANYNTNEFEKFRANKPDAPTIITETLDVPEFNADFEIEKPYTIPSDRKPYSIKIKSFDLAATYQYFAVPKLDKDAFLLAKVVGWEELDLVSGPINIYNNEKFIGQSKLSIDNLDDTLSVSLGRDPNVVVARKKIKGSSKKVFLGAHKKATIAYDITVRNNHKKSINIEILDQVPISSDKDVVVVVDDKSDGEYDISTGVLSWKFALDGQKTAKKTFGFSIKYPKDKQITIQYKKSKKIMQSRYF